MEGFSHAWYRDILRIATLRVEKYTLYTQGLRNSALPTYVPSSRKFTTTKTPKYDEGLRSTTKVS